VLGLAPGEVSDLEPEQARQLVNARIAYDEVIHRRPAYDAARMNAFFSMYPHVKKGSLKHPTDLLKFSHEEAEEKKKPELSPEKLGELMAKLDK